MDSKHGKFQARKVYGSSEETCLAQISLGADQLAVAAAAHAGLWERDTVMAMTKDLPQIHLPCWSCYCLSPLQLYEANQPLGLDT